MFNKLCFPYLKKISEKEYLVFDQWYTEAGMWHLVADVDLEEKIPSGHSKEYGMKFVLQAAEGKGDE